MTVTILSAGSSPYLSDVLAAVAGGRRRPDQFDIIWSGGARAVPAMPAGATVHHIPPQTFDHGGTRRLATERCTGAILAFLSDDAVPAGDGWLEALVAPFADPAVAAVYGRQVARADAPLFERVFRSTKYPAQSRCLGPADGPRIAAALAPVSDANAAYRVSALRAVGGFPERAPFGEDVVIALALVRAGYEVRYAADAVVTHSHELTRGQMFARGRAAAAAEAQSTGRATGPTAPGAATLVTSMLRQGWREHGMAGVLAVMEGVGARLAGYYLGRRGSGAAGRPRPAATS